MAKDNEREKFHQDLLLMSTYRLRRACIDAGLPINVVREAEQKGEECMIELLMEKYDAGDVSQPGTPKSKAKSGGGGKKTTRKAKRAEPEEELEIEDPEEADLEDPSQEYQDPEDDGDPEDLDNLWAEDTDDLDIEPDEEVEEEPPPKKQNVKRQAMKEEEAMDAEQSGIEEQITQLMDMQVTIAENVDALNKTVLKLSMAVHDVQKHVVFLKEFIELGAGSAFRFLKAAKISNPLKNFQAIRAKAYEKSKLEQQQSDGSRKAKT